MIVFLVFQIFILLGLLVYFLPDPSRKHDKGILLDPDCDHFDHPAPGPEHGRLDQTAPTIENGVNLDIPTLLRKRKKYKNRKRNSPSPGRHRRGRFHRTAPTIEDGENLDIPTLLRR